jgi:hypothetical protein
MTNGDAAYAKFIGSSQRKTEFCPRRERNKWLFPRRRSEAKNLDPQSFQKTRFLTAFGMTEVVSGLGRTGATCLPCLFSLGIIVADRSAQFAFIRVYSRLKMPDSRSQK